MKIIALPLLVVALGSLGVSARADDPDLTPAVVFETDPMSLGARDSMIVHLKQRGPAVTHYVVEFFDAQGNELSDPDGVVVQGSPVTLTLLYSALGTSATLAAVWAQITVADELLPDASLAPSSLSITIEHTNQLSGGISTSTAAGSCLLKGPRIHGGGRDSKCSGNIALVEGDE